MPTPRYRRILLWGLLAAGLLAPGWLVASGRVGLRDWPRPAAASAPTSTVVAAAPVTVAPVTYRPVTQTIKVAGTLFGYEEVSICATTEGRVVKLDHDVADRVRPGELLLSIDPTDYELAVQQAEKALLVELAKLGLQAPPDADFDVTCLPIVREAIIKADNCKSHLERAEALAVRKAICEEQLEDKRDDYRVAQAEYENQILQAQAALATIQVKQEALAMARQRLADTKVKAPDVADAAGPGGAVYAVSRRTVTGGSYVHAGEEIFRLVIDRTLKLRVPVPDAQTNDVHNGQCVEVSTAGCPTAMAGKVTRINPRVDPATKTFEVEVQVPNREGFLKAGSSAQAAILLRGSHEAATVPAEAALTADGQSKLLVAEGDRIRAVPVTLGAKSADWVEVVRPTLPRGAQVVTSGQLAAFLGSLRR